MRNWAPYVADTLARDGARRRAAARSASSSRRTPTRRAASATWRRSTRAAPRSGRARRRSTYVGVVARAPAVRRGARRARDRRARTRRRATRRARSSSPRTASRPPAAERSPYVAELGETARRSRPRSARRALGARLPEPQRQPARPVARARRERRARARSPRSGARDVVVAPIGFVCDHVEVLYDLDVEARATAAGARPRASRAPARVNDHPAFVAHAGRRGRGSARGVTAHRGRRRRHRRPRRGAPRSSSTRRPARALDVVLLEAAGRLGGSVAHRCARGGFVARARRRTRSSPTSRGRSRSASASASPTDLVGTREGDRRTHVVHGGRLHPLPEGFLLLAPTALVAGRDVAAVLAARASSRMALDLVLPRAPGGGDESLAASSAAASAARRSSASPIRSSAASTPPIPNACRSPPRCRASSSSSARTAA